MGQPWMFSFLLTKFFAFTKHMSNHYNIDTPTPPAEAPEGYRDHSRPAPADHPFLSLIVSWVRVFCPCLDLVKSRDSVCVSCDYSFTQY